MLQNNALMLLYVLMYVLYASRASRGFYLKLCFHGTSPLLDRVHQRTRADGERTRQAKGHAPGENPPGKFLAMVIDQIKKQNIFDFST